MLNNLWPMLAAVSLGIALGIAYFGGLWFTVRAGLHSPVPALWFSVSFLARTAMAVGGLLWAAHAGWQRLLACLAGFVAARVLVQMVCAG